MDQTSLTAARLAVTEALAAGTSPGGLRAAQLFEHGTMELYHYAPRGTDEQTPHDQDELYIVMAGTGMLAVGETAARTERVPFQPGDTMFVPAGMPHRFEDFTDDFETWVVMYGPDGGETATGAATH